MTCNVYKTVQIFESSQQTQQTQQQNRTKVSQQSTTNKPGKAVTTVLLPIPNFLKQIDTVVDISKCLQIQM